MERLRRLAIVTTIATYFLITVGAFVRAAGAGLGCPHWPLCIKSIGRLLPPTSLDQVPPDLRADFNIAKAWIEYVNRLIGVAIGLLILATFVLAWRHARRERGIFVPIAVALALVAYQGWFGGQVVEHKLDPRLVSIHLVLALVIVGLLLYATVNTWRPRLAPRTALPEPADRRLDRLHWIGLSVLAVQVLLGALVRGKLEIVAKEEPALPRSAWIDEVGAIDLAHRELAIVAAALVALAFLWVRRRAEPHRALRAWAAASLVLVIVQVAAGAGLAYAGLAPWLQVVHLTLGSWLAGTFYLQAILLRRRPPAAA